MENSEIYNLLEHGLLDSWRKIAEDEDECGFTKDADTAKAELLAVLNDSEKKLLTSCLCALETKLGYIYYNVNIKILNYGIKIGMEINAALHEYEEHI